MPSFISDEAVEHPIGRRPTALYRLLYAKLTDHRKSGSYGNTLNVKLMSDQLEVTTQNIYRWLKNNEVPARRAKRLIDLPGSKLSMDDLEPFLTSN